MPIDQQATLEGWLNQLGAQGWELVSAMPQAAASQAPDPGRDLIAGRRTDPTGPTTVTLFLRQPYEA